MLVEFLKSVLPTQGYKCWVEINRAKKVTQGFVPTIEELAAKVLEISARGNDAYFALGGYATDRNRRAANAGWFKCFWADIDCGEGKPHATQEDALSAIDEFCDRCPLPIPGIVKSGNGLHAYWVLDREISRAEWLPVAERFKLLCVKGFSADPTRTADAASILRPPQTRNYKDPSNPRDVELYDLADFLPSPVESIDSPSCTNPSISAVKKQGVNSPLPISNSLSSGIRQGFDPDLVVSEGGRNNAVHRCACYLRAKGFSEEETYLQGLEYSQKKCVPPLPEDEARKAIASGIAFIKATQPAPVVKDDELPKKLPHGFRWDRGALYYDAKGKDESGKDIVEPHCVSDKPIFFKGLANKEAGERCHSSVMKVFDREEGWHEFVMSMEQVYSNDWRPEISKHGGTINYGKDKYFKQFMVESERIARDMPKIKQYNQLGWKNDYKSFLVGNTIFHAAGDPEKAIGTPKLQPFMNFMTPRGTLEGWQAAAQKFTMKGAEPLLAFLVASFAAPLVPFTLDAGNGGCVFSMRTEESGYGKTPTVQAVSSVWGEMSACRVTGTYTLNRIQTELVHRCHLPQIVEEMPMTDEMILSRFIKDFTNGTSKGRLNSRGEIAGEPEYFQTILMSMSNISLYELVKMHDEPMSHRIFEISPPLPPEVLLDNLGAITREMGMNCGMAGIEFMRYVMQPSVMQWVLYQLRGPKAEILGEMQAKYRKLMATVGADRYVVGLLSAMEVTAVLLNHTGILEFEVDRLMNYLLEASKWMLTAGVVLKDATPILRPIEHLTEFLNTHWQNVVLVAGPHIQYQTQIAIQLPKGEVYMRRERNTETLYIDQKPLQRWCTERRLDTRKLAAELQTIGVLKKTSVSVTLGGGVTELSTGRSYCWEVDMKHPSIAHAAEVQVAGKNVLSLKL